MISEWVSNEFRTHNCFEKYGLEPQLNWRGFKAQILLTGQIVQGQLWQKVMKSYWVKILQGHNDILRTDKGRGLILNSIVSHNRHLGAKIPQLSFSLLTSSYSSCIHILHSARLNPLIFPSSELFIPCIAFGNFRISNWFFFIYTSCLFICILHL